MKPVDAWPDVPADVVWTVFAVYVKPLDFPDHWVVRRWFDIPGRGLVPDVVPRISDTLLGARGHVPPEFSKNIWDERDDPFLHEAWATPDYPAP